jgi:Flp pilus assembly protein TadG
LVLIAPAVIGLAFLVVALGHRVDGRAQAQSAAESAAQSAALQRTAWGARRSAEETAGAMLVDPHSCHDPQVRVDTDDFRPGGSVRVTVSCSSARVLSVVETESQLHEYTAVAHIDRYRAAEGTP